LFASHSHGSFGKADLVRHLLSRCPFGARGELPLLDYVLLRMAEGIMAFLEEQHEKAIHHFEAVLGLESEVKDKELIAIANFWIGRCYRHQGRYDDALGYVAKARAIAPERQFPKMSAVMQVLVGWILFQEGELNEAAWILGEAEPVLLGTDDSVSRGNINSTYGRMERRNGKYDQALKCFANRRLATSGIHQPVCLQIF